MDGYMSSQPLETYTDSDATDHEKAKLWLAQRLRQTDSENRVSGRQLAEDMPQDFGVSESTTRDLIAEVRRDYGIPVYSFGRGYYQLTDVNDLERAIEQMNGTIRRKEKTKRELTQAFNRP